MLTKLLPIDRLAPHLEIAIFTVFTLWCSLVTFIAFTPPDPTQSLGPEFVLAMYVLFASWYIVPVFSFRQFLKIRRERRSGRKPTKPVITYLSVFLGVLSFLYGVYITVWSLTGGSREDITITLVIVSFLASLIGGYAWLSLQNLYYSLYTKTLLRYNLLYPSIGLLWLLFGVLLSLLPELSYGMSRGLSSLAFLTIPLFYTVYIICDH